MEIGLYIVKQMKGKKISIAVYNSQYSGLSRSKTLQEDLL